MEKATLSRQQVIGQVLKIGHKDLSQYVNIGIQSTHEDPEFFAHLVAWNFMKGEIRDSKVALPVIGLRGKFDQELTENHVAHLCLLDPRNLLRAIRFNFSLSETWGMAPGSGKLFKKGVARYLREREASPGWWSRTALQHRTSLKELYALFHIKPSNMAQRVLFKREKPKGSVFEAVANLKHMSAQEAAGTILNFKIPFLVAVGALSGIKDKPDIIMALIEQASGSEIIGNTEMFRRMGVFDNPVLKASYDAAIERAKQDKRVSSLKAKRATEKITDKKVQAKMKTVSDEKLDQLGGIEGDWLVLADRSGSMERSIEIGKQVASMISQQVKGKVHLVFFDTSPKRYNVTGKDLPQIEEMTRHVRPGGSTSIGCGLELIMEMGEVVNGIAIVSDGGQNREPTFPKAYEKYVDKIGINPTVYLLWVPGDNNRLTMDCERQGIPIQEYDVSGMDYYSLPNLVKTMRASRFMLAEEIMQTRLLTLDDVFSKKEVA